MAKKLSEKAQGTLKTTEVIKRISAECGLTREEIMQKVEEKKHELKGLISEEGVLFIISKELGVDIKEPKGSLQNAFGSNSKKVVEVEPQKESKAEIVKNPQPKINQDPPEHQEFPMEIVNQSEITLKQKEKMLLDNIQLYTFMVSNVLDRKKDYFKYPNGSEHIKRSGCLKLALAFNLSVEPVSIEIEREYDKEGKEIDIHAHATAKIVRQNGSYVIATGTKSKSEYYSKRKQNYGSYNLHNLRTTAMTKATNHGIVDAIGFAQVTYEEMEKPTDKKVESGDIKDAFGNK